MHETSEASASFRLTFASRDAKGVVFPVCINIAATLNPKQIILTYSRTVQRRGSRSEGLCRSGEAWAALCAEKLLYVQP